VRAKFAVEVVKGLHRLVQIAAVPQALDDLCSRLEKYFLARPVTPAALDFQGAAVVFERYREVVRGEVEVAELLSLVIPIRSRFFTLLGRRIPQGTVRMARTVFGYKSFHAGPRLPNEASY
jgi:hypothetical protein